MQFAYLSTDEVNQALALELALECGVSLHQLAPKEGPPDRGYDAVLCDWDSWPPEGRREFLAETGGMPYRPAAVHGYNLDEDEADILTRRGVTVYRNIQREVFLRLCRALMPTRAPNTSEHDQGSAVRFVT